MPSAGIGDENITSWVSKNLQLKTSSMKQKEAKTLQQCTSQLQIRKSIFLWYLFDWFDTVHISWLIDLFWSKLSYTLVSLIKVTHKMRVMTTKWSNYFHSYDYNKGYGKILPK